ncbi:MAG: hypothetical protein WAM60_08460, partial [Candidatus Promineifilaceae bacterium]
VFGNGLIPGEEDKVREWIDEIPAEKRPRFFFNTGSGDSYVLDMAKEMVEILDQSGIEYTTIFTAGGHNYAYWVSNMPAYWQWVAEDWR